MELTSEKSCCSAGNNQVDEQAGITQHRWQLSLPICQAPLSMEFSRQEYWSELPFPSPTDLPVPGIKPGSPTLQADSLPSEPPEKSSEIKQKNRCRGQGAVGRRNVLE